MYTNQQPNVNTWKCHNPQWRVFGWIFAGGGEKHPVLLQSKQNRGWDGCCSHQGQQAAWGPPPWRRDGGAEAAQRAASVLFQVLFQAPQMQRSVITPPPIRDKDVTGEGAATQQPATSHVHGAIHPRAPSKISADKYFWRKEAKIANDGPADQLRVENILSVFSLFLNQKLNTCITHLLRGFFHNCGGDAFHDLKIRILHFRI